MFAIEVEFLTGRYYAASAHDRGQPEWPPHPARLFSALVASWHEYGGTDAEKQALLWLEKQAPPSISAGDYNYREAPTVFVPVNDVKTSTVPSGKTKLQYLQLTGVLPERRSKQPRNFPSCSVESPVYFVWNDANPTDAERIALENACAHVSSFGHSSSLVRIRPCITPPSCTYIPDVNGDTVLRTTSEGQWDALEGAFAVHSGLRQRTLPCVHTAYRNLNENPLKKSPSQGVFGDQWAILRITSRPVLLKAALGLCRTFRDAMMAKGPQPLPEWLSGHNSDGGPSQMPHVAFIPLPDIGHMHASGRVMGIAAVPPRSLSPADLRELSATAQRTSHTPLGGKWTVELVTEPDRATLSPVTWVKTSRAWASVTPFVFDRDPKDDLWGHAAEDVVRKACKLAKLPEPQSISVTPVSRHIAVPLARDFPRKESPNKPARRHAHVEIFFSEAIAGPVLLGAGRYYGYGLFKPVPITVEIFERPES